MPEVDVTAVEKEWRNLHKEDLFFEWSIKAFANDLKPQLRCVCCGRGGHLIETCPDLELPPIIPIQPLSNKQKEFLELVILDTYERLRMTPEYGCMMRDLCENLEKCLCDKYRSDCRLALFGSAGNGFGLIGSDADICLRFESETFTEDIDACEVITTVAEVVSTMPGIISVTPVPSAKVPIVKIQCNNRYHRLEADLSLYNVLALENTRLLRAYSELDERATVLGVLVKEWAKCCEIGDASRGSLSSYSFIVMLIHFLQRTTPPIEGRTCPKEARIVDGCDVYFCTAKDSEWHTKNVENVTELWLGFLDYFSRRFDFTAEVVQIRRKEPLSKLDKRWQGKPIAIEDPFDLKHNLSCGVHLQTMAYIKRSFIQSRERFARIRVPTRQLSNRRFEAFLIELLHDCRVGDGPPLARNCCYRCKQIGHFVENCPVGQKGHKRYNQSRQCFCSAAMLANRKYLRSGKGTNVEENRERQLRKGSLADDELPSKADSQMSTNRGNGGRGRCRPGHMEHFSEPDRKDDLCPLSPFPVMVSFVLYCDIVLAICFRIF
ncbi:unnamed protein product [Toxocara canis]|uniref:CCHC-type domain-containing protein n=1 Tax=Toxocara canis TaxID=6265 RepID=A0A183VD72_TOXCA|nr:unnamed protein product [Toxocara canis]